MGLDIDYILLMFERKVEKIVCLLNLFIVYKEMLCCFNECKRLINIFEFLNVIFV